MFRGLYCFLALTVALPSFSAALPCSQKLWQQPLIQRSISPHATEKFLAELDRASPSVQKIVSRELGTLLSENRALKSKKVAAGVFEIGFIGSEKNVRVLYGRSFQRENASSR